MAEKHSRSAQAAKEAQAIANAIFELMKSRQVPALEGLMGIATAMGIAVGEAMVRGDVSAESGLELYEISKNILLERVKSHLHDKE